ncbi:MAG TPA: glycosyltransferase family 4 protein [Chloroflexota bacterium]|nr:glycosyltransferase family 4 protein [Chloroflexota bacterium]
MKILFLLPSLPDPPDAGAKLRNLALIRAAAAHHDVDVLAFHGRDVDGGARLHACHLVRTVPLPDPRGPARRAWGLLTDQAPDLARRLESGAFATALREILESSRYDVVQIEGLEMMPYLHVVQTFAPRAAIVYDAHNAEMWLQRTIFQAELRDPARWPAALYAMAQWSKLGSYERIMMNETSLVLAVSEVDAGKLKGRRVSPEIVPNAVDTSGMPFREPRPEPNDTLFFAGSLAYRPNADAVRWLTRSVLPLVRARLPRVRLRLAGRGTERIRGDGVEPLGYVEDIGSELARADVAVVPMRMGSGVRFKVLEAMAAGVPVVSTTLGISGVSAQPGRHVLIANRPSEFAEAVAKVIEDRALARSLAIQARQLVENRYDWDRVTPVYLRLLSNVRRGRKRADGVLRRRG